MTWSALHAYYHADRQATDRLVVDGVRPLVERLLADKRIDGWFFIRYWEGGPHIRLRLRGADPATIAAAGDELRRYLRDAPATQPAPDPTAFYASFTSDPEAAARHGWIASGEVEPRDYEAETERYGGPAGLAISENLFQASSRVALAAIQARPDPQQRLLVALQLLLGLLQAIELPDLDAVAWLRGCVNAWPQTGLVSAEQAWHTCNAAEREFLAKTDSWLKLRAARTSDPGARGPNLVSYWVEAVREAFRRYRAAETDGKLTAPPLAILRSQLHMLHNRLGLTVAEECYLEWLASLIIARPQRHASYTRDAIDVHDRLYHEQSKLIPFLLTEQMAQATVPSLSAPPRVAAAPWTQRVPLTRPAAPDDTVAHLEKVLLARRSEAANYGGELTAGQLALLLELSVGRIPDERIEVAGGRIVERKRRTHPSAGGRYAIMTYVLPRNVEGVPPALYWFDVEGHALERIAAAPPIENVLSSSHMLTTLDDRVPVTVQARNAPLWLFPVADLSFQRKRYGLRAYRLVLQECGHMAQNVYLVAAALGLSCITIGGYFDDLLSHTLLLDGVNRVPLYMIPIGGGRQ